VVRANILRGEVKFEPRDVWDDISPLAKRFILDLLVKDPKGRPTASECQKHPWIAHFKKGGGGGGGKALLSPQVVESLINFKSYDNMRKLICEIISFTLVPDQIGELRKEFERADTEQSGEITLGGLKTILANSAAAGDFGALTEEEILQVSGGGG
jgi:calcium-dependent protein kinase